MNQTGRNKTNKNKSNVFTRETLGVVLVLFCTLALVCLITREKVFSVPGQYINAFLLGIFGYFAFAIVLWGIIGGVLLITDKKCGLTFKQLLFVTLGFIALATFLHLLSMGDGYSSYGEYLSKSYTNGESGLATASAGGVIVALYAYVFYALLTLVGGCVVTGILFGVCAYFLIMDLVKQSKQKVGKEESKLRSSYVPQYSEEDMGIELSGVKDYPVQGVTFEEKAGTQRLFVNNPDDFQSKTKKEIAKSESVSGIKLDFSTNGLGVGNFSDTYSTAYADDMKKKIEYIKTPAQINLDGGHPKYYDSIRVSSPIAPSAPTSSVSAPISTPPKAETPVENIPEPEKTTAIPLFEHDGNNTIANDAGEHALRFRDKYAVEEFDQKPVVSEPIETFTPLNIPAEKPFEEPIKEEKDKDFSPEFDGDLAFSFGGDDVETKEEPPAKPELTESRTRRILFEDNKSENKVEPVREKPTEDVERTAFNSRAVADGNRQVTAGRFAERLNKLQNKEEPVEEEKPKKPAPPINREYFRPPLDLLETHTVAVDPAEEGHEERMEIIQRTLEEFHINAIPQSYVQGPSITRYEVMMPAGISVKNVLRYDDDLKMRLSSKNGVRIEAPIPGKNLVGIEVANKRAIPVGLKEVLEGAADKKCKPDALMFAIGKNLVGESITDNLAKGPHYLVAGATGSGKSVCLNVMIISLIMRYSPEELRLILVDPKRVGFRTYEHLPHLLIDEVITEPQRAVAALQWAYDEMERRYKMFEECDGYISDIGAYNAEIASDTVAKLPRIVVVVDELADLMETCKKDMEARIRALAAKARAAGIHLVLATQRPSVDVITGTIKANLPSRIALKVMNFADSSTILSEGGAEKLLGNGDMLYKNSGMSECERYQGAWISDREINNIVKYIKEHNTAYFDESLQEFLDKANKPKVEEGTSMDTSGDDDDGINEFFLKALWLAVVSGSVSISQLQRRFQIGYARAGGLVDKMERMGFVSGNEGSKARRVLLSTEEYEERFGPAPDMY